MQIGGRRGYANILQAHEYAESMQMKGGPDMWGAEAPKYANRWWAGTRKPSWPQEYANCMQMRGVVMQIGDVHGYANDLLVPGYANEGWAAAGMQMQPGGGRGHADEGEATPTDMQMRRPG